MQSDYYQIPTEDKEALKHAETKIREDLKNSNEQENIVENESQKENNLNGMKLNRSRVTRNCCGR